MATSEEELQELYEGRGWPRDYSLSKEEFLDLVHELDVDAAAPPKKKQRTSPFPDNSVVSLGLSK